MPFEFRLPDIGEGVVEGEIIKWHVKPGQEVKEDDPMVEVMTDKATVMIPSPRKGRILETRGEEGGIVKVGAVMLVMDTGDGAGSAEPKAKAEMPTASTAPSTAAPQAAPSPRKEGARALATPAVRKMAQDMGIDINEVQGSGPGGRVSKEDLENFKKGAPTGMKEPQKAKVDISEAVHAKVYSDVEEVEEIPLRGLRKKIAEKMVQSKQTAPHYTYVDEIDMSNLVTLRKSSVELAKAQGIKLTYLPFIMKAIVFGLKKYPLLNASLDDAKGKIHLKRFYNIGLGVATPDGLTVAVIKHADKKSIFELAQDIARLSEAARTNKIVLEDLKGGTFTITSLGNTGGMFATPIINYPEVAIAGVHKIEQRPVVRDGQIVIREMMYLSLSFDHRVVDGAIGAEFCQYVKNFLENPTLMFLQF